MSKLDFIIGCSKRASACVSSQCGRRLTSEIPTRKAGFPQDLAPLVISRDPVFGRSAINCRTHRAGCRRTSRSFAE